MDEGLYVLQSGLGYGYTLRALWIEFGYDQELIDGLSETLIRSEKYLEKYECDLNEGE